MNQILLNPRIRKRHKLFFHLVLTFSLIVILFSLLYYFSLVYKKNKRKVIQNHLLQPYSISKLYSSINLPYGNSVHSSPYIIGTLIFPTLSLKLPVLSEMNDELLTLSVCRFYGPMPNEVGNICIAGHNYNNGSFFSNIPLLSVGDTIILTDLSHNQQFYKIYEKYEINARDTSCTSQETNGQKEITLVTCNNFTGNRIIIKAK